MRNILCKLPRKAQKEMKALLHQVYRASGYQEGLRLGRELIARFRGLYPSAMECLTYLRFPQAHWKAIRTTNPLERLFGEGRRRTKVIPRFLIESSGLRLWLLYWLGQLEGKGSGKGSLRCPAWGANSCGNGKKVARIPLRL